MNWQPIETAPKNVDILAVGDPEWPDRVAIGRVWNDGHFRWDVNDSNSMWGQPTHWHPIPEFRAPPAST